MTKLGDIKQQISIWLQKEAEKWFKQIEKYFSKRWYKNFGGLYL